VSFAEAVGNSESSATRGYLFERTPDASGCRAPCRLSHRGYGLEHVSGASSMPPGPGIPGPAPPVDRVDLNLLPGGGLAGQMMDAPTRPAVSKNRDAARTRRSITTCMVFIVCPHIMRSEPFHAPAGH